MPSLNNQLTAAISQGPVPFKVPREISANLNCAFTLRPYQQEAFARFAHYWEHYRQTGRPVHLLFQMATGSGKTLVMAGCMLALYRLGYRHFIFFVNSTSIIEKTRDNFLNSQSSKYLFAPVASVMGQKITLMETGNFQAAHPNAMQLVFTTIQGLHTTLNNPGENSLTLADFESNNVVLLSDEAHHINADTRGGKPGRKASERAASWESTVGRIVAANPGNCLLEFTATADLSRPEIRAKYRDKLLFDYPLSRFHQDGYSKAVKVLQAGSPPFERALQAVILSQYRRKLFEKNGQRIKPVILLKSRTIAESKRFFEAFVTRIGHLTPEAITRARSAGQGTALERAFSYFSAAGMTATHLVEELREDFSADKCISVDSKNDSIEKQLVLNRLEDDVNRFRAVFAVDMLNEGWDVLNLFDIVRLYDTRDATAEKIRKTTMSEAQLIGRGARYCPFQRSENQPRDQRKYDKDRKNELRICETLYYHASHNPRYIAELDKALTALGLKTVKTAAQGPALRGHKQQSGTDRYDPYSTVKRAPALQQALRDRTYRYDLPSGDSQEADLFAHPAEKHVLKHVPKKKQHILLHSFGHPVLRKAMDHLPFYRFDNLKKYFPGLDSLSEFIDSDDFLKPVKVCLSGSANQLRHLHPADKLRATLRVLEEIAKELSGLNHR